jgi:hypothetical protein
MKASTLWNFNELKISKALCFLMYDQVQGLNIEKATMISIEGLLEDAQGLRMGELLTVKIRQPSHEFTFDVGISFIPYLLVLTPVV